MLVSQTSPVVSYETQSRLAKIEIADGSVSQKAIENKKTKWYSQYRSDNRETNDNLNPLYTLPKMINIFHDKKKKAVFHLPFSILPQSSVMYLSLSGLVCSWKNPKACMVSWTTVPSLSHPNPIEITCSLSLGSRPILE